MWQTETREECVYTCKEALRPRRMKIWLLCFCALDAWSSLFPESPTDIKSLSALYSILYVHQKVSKKTLWFI